MNSLPDPEDSPHDPAVERVRRKVMRLMGISIAIMIFGLMAVIGTIFYKINSNSNENIASVDDKDNKSMLQVPTQQNRADASTSNLTGNIEIPDGSEIIKADLSGGQILLSIKSREGDNSLWVYDLMANRVFAKITIGK